MLPKGWRAHQLGELMRFRNGLNYTNSDTGEEIKIVGVADFQSRSAIEDASELQRIRVSGQVADADLLKSGDLLFVRSNGNKTLIGRCLYFPKVNERLSFSGFTIRGRADTTKLDSEFAAYLMRSAHVAAQMHLGGSGTNISNLSQEILNEVRVTIPVLREQRSITAVLKTWDAAISTTEKLLANSRRQKWDLMQGLLSGHRRFGPKKPRWMQPDFDEVFERITRKNSFGNQNVLTISGQYGLISQREYFNKSVASENLKGYTLLERGDFAYNKSYSIGYPVGAIKPLLAYESGVVSSLYICFRIRPDVETDADFFRHYFEAGMLNDAITGIAQEGARNHGLLNVSLKDFFKLKLHVPTIETQQKIGEVLNAAESDERCIEQQLEKLKQEKRALMADLLTGKRRVCLPDATAEMEVA